MKKTLIFGLALAFGLSACEPIPHFGDYAYIIAKYDGKVIGETMPSKWANEDAVAKSGTAVVAAKKGTIYKVLIETTFPIWSLEHLIPWLKVTDETGKVVFDDFVDNGAGDYDLPLEIKPKGGPNAGDRILINSYVSLTYRCIFAKWGYIDEKGKLVKEDGEYLPAVKIGIYTYELEIERLADENLGDCEAEYHIYVEGRHRSEPESYLLDNLYQQWVNLRSYHSFLYNMGAPKYTGFKLVLPNVDCGANKILW